MPVEIPQEKPQIKTVRQREIDAASTLHHAANIMRIGARLSGRKINDADTEELVSTYERVTKKKGPLDSEFKQRITRRLKEEHR